MFLSSLTRAGDRALIDRELSLPKAWTDDRARGRAAGIGDDVAVATTPELARRRLERAGAAGIPFAGVTADDADRQHRALRRRREHTRLPSVRATRRDDVR